MPELNTKNLLLFGLLAVALAVIFVLPSFVSDPVLVPDDYTRDIAAPATDEPSPSRVAEKKQFRQQAQDTLAEVFASRDRLTAKQVRAWAEVRFERAMEWVASGDQAYSLGHYEEALADYARARDDLAALESDSQARLEKTLAAVADAVEDSQREAATEGLELLNYLAPEDPRVIALTGRVEQLPAVMTLLETAREQRGGGDLAAAKAALAEAVAADPEHQRAARLLAEVAAEVKERQFSELMGRGYSAMEAGEWSRARDLFRRAGDVEPGNSAAAQALTQLENRGARQQVEVRLARARALERREQWAEAVDLYEALVAEDSSLTEPRARLVPARVRAQLDSRLEGLLSDPLALSRPPLADRASGVLADARGIADPGPRLRGQIERLSTLLARASEPVAVEFRSDNQTRVTLYRVGELGTFDATTVELMPGRYIVAGARRGYRDVQVEFTVTGEQPDAPIVVRCTEAI